METLRLGLLPRYWTYAGSLLGTVLFLLLSFVYTGFAIPFAIALGLAILGTHDVLQTRHSILRNYPILAHVRFMLEAIRPEMRQYFLESDTDGKPFSRDKRAVVYQRAKHQLDKRPFGSQLDPYEDRFEWLNHSIVAKEPNKEPFRVTIGGPDCTRPYSASIFNISAMSFGALSANAIRALNKGARLGGFFHDTGEGGFSPYHREFGGDVVWEIGSGYFGCRNPDGTFSAERFRETVASDQIRMIEIKLSQGAKPGHGGVLPAAKVSKEISITRGVPMGQDCVSPPRHSAFATPLEMMAFVKQLRELSDGRPVGFKLCVGHPWEFLAICKAMIETGIYPDFIVVDGTEGGTGASPPEFLDHVGSPMREGLLFVHNALVGLNIRDRVKLGAAGKIVSAFDIARAMALGADWCNSARGFMFAIGCIQSQSCHTDRCPVGVATQDPVRQEALHVPDKAERVANFHKSTLTVLSEVVAAAGLSHPDQLRAHHLSQRIAPNKVKTFDRIYRFQEPGEILRGTNDPRYVDPWKMARADSFEAAR